MTTRLASALVDAVIDRADLYDMEVRHPRATLLGYVSTSLGALRRVLTAGGFSGLLDWTTPAQLPTAPPIAGENFLEIDWPSGAVSIHGVDVNSSGTTGRWYPLDTMTLVERRDFYGQANIPRAWVLRSIPKEKATPDGSLDPASGKINLYPASTLGLYYRVLYLPAYPTLNSENNLIHALDEDWYEWVIWNATILALFKDDEMDPSQDQKAVRERQIVQERMLVNINRTNRAAPIQPTRAGGLHFRRT